MKIDRDRQEITNKMFKQIESKLKETKITAVGTVDDGDPIIAFGSDTEVNDPNVSQTGSN